MIFLLDLLKDHDVICVQEHWLYEFESTLLNQVSKSHSCYAKCVDSNDPVDPTRRSRGHGGVAIFWPTTWDSKVTKQPDGDWRFAVITIKGKVQNLCIICAYMPCRGKGHSSAEYAYYLDMLWSIVNKYCEKYVVVVCGDLNANPVNPGDSRDNVLSSFCGDHGLETPRTYYEGNSFFHKGGQGE